MNVSLRAKGQNMSFWPSVANHSLFARAHGRTIPG